LCVVAHLPRLHELEQMLQIRVTFIVYFNFQNHLIQILKLKQTKEKNFIKKKTRFIINLNLSFFLTLETLGQYVVDQAISNELGGVFGAASVFFVGVVELLQLALALVKLLAVGFLDCDARMCLVYVDREVVTNHLNLFFEIKNY
jgi:hypothetical protein